MRILRLNRYERMRLSAVCRNFSPTDKLPISAAYDRFVSAETGLIERFTGVEAYRMDVDGDVDQGDSWQLAVFVAHALKAFDALAERDIRAKADAGEDMIVLATGALDIDCHVGPVERVARKLDAASALAADAAAKKIPLLILLPPGEGDAAEEAALDRLRAAGGDVEVLRPKSVRFQAEPWRGAPAAAGGAKDADRARPRRRALPPRAAAIALGSAAGLGGLALIAWAVLGGDSAQSDSSAGAAGAAEAVGPALLIGIDRRGDGSCFDRPDYGPPENLGDGDEISMPPDACRAELRLDAAFEGEADLTVRAGQGRVLLDMTLDRAEPAAVLRLYGLERVGPRLEVALARSGEVLSRSSLILPSAGAPAEERPSTGDLP